MAKKGSVSVRENVALLWLLLQGFLQFAVGARIVKSREEFVTGTVLILTGLLSLVVGMAFDQACRSAARKGDL